jgi:hypothetical protein
VGKVEPDHQAGVDPSFPEKKGTFITAHYSPFSVANDAILESVEVIKKRGLF